MRLLKLPFSHALNKIEKEQRSRERPRCFFCCFTAQRLASDCCGGLKQLKWYSRQAWNAGFQVAFLTAAFAFGHGFFASPNRVQRRRARFFGRRKYR